MSATSKLALGRPNKPTVIIVNVLDFPNRYAAWFGIKRAKTAIRIAETSYFNVLKIDDEATEKLASQLKEGSLTSLNGLSLSLVDDQLAQELETLIAERRLADAHLQSSSENAAVPAPASAEVAPALWTSLAVGTLVLAADLDREGAPEAWFEAYIVSVGDNELQLRWRDFPREGLLTRTRKHIALLHPVN